MYSYYFVTDDPKKTEHLLALEGAKERLHLFKANLLEEGAFDPIVDGCEGVFHTASPVSFSPTDDPQVLPSYMLLPFIIYHHWFFWFATNLSINSRESYETTHVIVSDLASEWRGSS